MIHELRKAPIWVKVFLGAIVLFGFAMLVTSPAEEGSSTAQGAPKPAATAKPPKAEPTAKPLIWDRDTLEFAVCDKGKEYVKLVLKAPATAKFPTCKATLLSAENPSDQRWVATGQVDSQNGFGALIRSSYRAEIQVLPTKDKATFVPLDVKVD